MTPSSQAQALALDIGGGHVSAARVDLNTRMVLPGEIHRAVDPNASADALLDAWAAAALEALAGDGLDGDGPPARIGIAVPSPFDHAAGVSWMTHKFAALHGVSVRDGLRDCWAGTALADVSLAFGNDADLFTLGEWWGGAGRGAGRVIGVTLGTGLGSGFVADGHVVTSGPDVPPDGELWNVPYGGEIAEDFASGQAVRRVYQSSGQEDYSASAAGIAALADVGDARARAAYAELGTHLGGILTPWVAQFRPDAVVFGGNVSRAWAHFRSALEAALPGVSCRITMHFEGSALLGAAALGSQGEQ
ncbi:Glucokinase [Deinococcus saxicola]|uniref:ROK family protein n=1 Tax=Deinococcus saxicola TaxID=249406 RepID=UPI0039EE35B4